ncbi:MAG: fluoride efflux transporter CrcB, partial [Gammaproteobacteria bacterium]
GGRCLNLVLAIGVGGALGSILRYTLSAAAHRIVSTTFPIGTLVVNVLGSIAIGVLYVWLIERFGARPELRAFLIVGVLGGFTTFSSFSLETVTLLMQASYGRAAVNVAASVLLCLLGTLAGIALGRQT